MPKRKLTYPFIKNFDPPEKRTEIYDTIESGLVIRITQTGHKSFVYRYRIGDQGGKRYTIGTFPSVGLAEARSRARELHSKVKDGIDPHREKSKRRQAPKDRTVQDLASYFKKIHLPNLASENEYKRILDKEILPVFKDHPVDSLQRFEIIEFLEEIAVDRGAPVMSNRVREVFSSMYTFAMKKAWVDHNIILTVEPLGEEKSRDRVYSDFEIKALWEAFEQEEEPIQSVYKMLLICGQRSGETKRMAWPAVDMKEALWTLEADETKPDRKHYVPLPPMAMNILEARRKVSGESSYVFESPRKKDQPIGWIQKAKDRIRETSKVDDFRPHDLRRTVASSLARLGVGRTVNGKVLNHKGMAGDNHVTAVYDRYEYMEEKRDALNRWDNLLSRIISEDTKTRIYKLNQ